MRLARHPSPVTRPGSDVAVACHSSPVTRHSPRPPGASMMALLHPRYWPTWIGLGVLRVFEPLPYPLLVWLGRRIGGLLAWLPLGFVRIARRNLELCLPQHSPAERQRILHEHFRSVGIGIFETALSWWSFGRPDTQADAARRRGASRGGARARSRGHSAERALHDARNRRPRTLCAAAGERHVSADKQCGARTIPHAQPRSPRKARDPA